jgi:threonine/homoserine/homoserine lactone efflux protein
MEMDPMVNSSSYAAFLVVAVIVIVVPGPDMFFIVATAVRGGPVTGFVAALGTAVGLAVHTTAAVLGLSALIAAVPPLYDMLRWAGAGYLLYLAVSMFRPDASDGGPPVVSSRGPGRSRAFWHGVVVDVLNPKTVLFFVALLPQFVDPTLGHTEGQLLLLGATFVLTDLVIDGLIGFSSGRLAQGTHRGRRMTRGLEVASGMVFVGLALKLAAH